MEGKRGGIISLVSGRMEEDERSMLMRALKTEIPTGASIYNVW